MAVGMWWTSRDFIRQPGLVTYALYLSAYVWKIGGYATWSPATAQKCLVYTHHHTITHFIILSVGHIQKWTDVLLPLPQETSRHNKTSVTAASQSAKAISSKRATLLWVRPTLRPFSSTLNLLWWHQGRIEGCVSKEARLRWQVG